MGRKKYIVMSEEKYPWDIWHNLHKGTPQLLVDSKNKN